MLEKHPCKRVIVIFRIPKKKIILENFNEKYTAVLKMSTNLVGVFKFNMKYVNYSEYFV